MEALWGVAERYGTLWSVAGYYMMLQYVTGALQSPYGMSRNVAYSDTENIDFAHH